MLRHASEKDKANQIVNLTSLTVEQFEALVEPFEQAFIEYMSKWTMEGKPRTARAYTPYVNSPLPTPQDRLLFVLSYMKAASLQVMHAALFDMSQSNANNVVGSGTASSGNARSRAAASRAGSTGAFHSRPSGKRIHSAGAH